MKSPQYIISLCVSMIMIGLFSLPPQATAANLDPTNELSASDIERFSIALDQIKKYYVKPIKNSQLFDNAIRGMLAGLDPHSAYLDKDDYENLKQTTRGDFAGLGIEVTMEDGLVKVISPLDDSPAKKAGVQAGDLIIRIDTTPIQGLSLAEAVAKLRGPQGSATDLTIIRQHHPQPIISHLTRATIKTQSVNSQLLETGYGYIRISQFQSPTAQTMVKNIAQLKAQSGGQLKGLILDLRNNPGGLLTSAIQVSDAFLDNRKLSYQQRIVSTKGRLPDSQFEAKASNGDILANAPLVLLINEGSASGSEIVAGALQDHQRAILMGAHTFGKGSVQTVIPLDEKRGVKLTTALYYTPKGRSIQAKGIEPDIPVEMIETPSAQPTPPLYLREADLTGHLPNPSKKNSLPHHALYQQDYQIHQALLLLKGLSLTKNTGSTET